MNEVLLTVIGTILSAIVLPLIALAGKSLINLINAKVKDERLKRALEDAATAVQKSVEKVAQTYSDDLKAAGRFDAEAQGEAFSRAFDNAKKLINEETQRLIAENLGDVSNWIDTAIEAYIHERKPALGNAEK